MDERMQRPWRRTILSVVTITLMVLVLSACGVGGDDNGDEEAEPTATEADVSPDESVTDLTGEPTPASEATPPEGGAPSDSGASPTPAIVVSAPPVTIPTAIPTQPGTPSTSSEGATPAGEPEQPAAGVSGVGDGTGGAVESSESVAGAPEDATPASGEGVAETIVDSCDVASYPPSDGEEGTQVTTVDVNFRMGPGTDCDPIGEPLSAGTVVDVLSAPVTREGDDQFVWVAVSVDGTEGWLATEFLEPTE